MQREWREKREEGKGKEGSDGKGHFLYSVTLLERDVYTKSKYQFKTILGLLLSDCPFIALGQIKCVGYLYSLILSVYCTPFQVLEGML